MSAELVNIPRPRTYGEKVAAEVRGEAARRQVTSARLAVALDVSTGSMSRRMTGKQPFTIDELAAVAETLGVRVEDLLPHLDSNQKPAGLQHDATVTYINDWKVAA